MLQSMKMAVLFGFLIWLIPFIVGFIASPVYGTPAFDTILTLLMVGEGLVFATLYFCNIERITRCEGVRLGALWFVISVIIDLAFYMPAASLRHMSFGAYMLDIGLMYLVFPMITIAITLLSECMDKTDV